MVKFIEVQSAPFVDIKAYKKFNPEIQRAILAASRKISGQRIIHINATWQGGGVTELLRSQVPFEKALGLKSHWLAIEDAPSRFFVITKKIHNLLQGKPGLLSKEEKNFYFSVNQQLGKSLKYFCQQYKTGIIVIHDPQPLPLIQFIPESFSSILRFHLDLSVPNATIIDFLRPLIADYKFVVLSNKDYFASMPWLEASKRKVIMPAIDPLSEKNQPMDIRKAKIILEKFGINPFKPLVAQISRFDAWKNPLGVIQAYYIAKKEIPNLQLALSGLLLATDDPQAKAVFERVKKHARSDPDIHLFADSRKLENISVDLFVDALYTASTVIIQNSIREGFGLTITEAMWKSKAVIAGMASGALLQIKNGKNGILASSPEEISKNIISLIKDKATREKLGKAAHLSVRRRFLLPRFILDNLKLYLSLNSKNRV